MSKQISISDKIITELIEAADRARDNSYAPYSKFRVGAALYTVSEGGEGVIITGCNVENASYPAGNCAERTAVFKAVSEGYNNFKAIAIVGGYDIKTNPHMIEYGMTESDSNNDDLQTAYTSPCGICRQVLREFVAPDEFYVIMAKSKTDYVIKTLEELLPMSFGPDNLAGA